LSELLEWAQARQAEMTRLLAEIVDIESPSDDPAGVRALATRLAQPLEAVGLDVELVPVMGAGPILRARTPGARRAVMLLGHLDTVWPRGTTAQRPARLEGGLLRGPGVYDMKGGLVVVVFALQALRALGHRVPVTVFFTPLEEVDCGPYREVMEAEMKGSAAVLDFEPAWPGGAVKTERKGSGSYVLTAHGVASHAGADLSRGANAILELARLCLQVSTLTDPERGLSANVGVIRGGLRPNVVPDLAAAEIDVRFRRWSDGEALERTLRALAPVDPRVRLTLEGGLHYPPLERTPAVLRVYEAARAVAREMGDDLAEVSTGGASEASFAGALGLPTLDGLGPDGDGAHSLDEHVILDSLPRRAALTAGLLRKLAADERG
jgi:glutamate carboxypeptidase